MRGHGVKRSLANKRPNQALERTRGETGRFIRTGGGRGPLNARSLGRTWEIELTIQGLKDHPMNASLGEPHGDQ